MSELQRKIQFCRKRGVYVFRWAVFYRQAANGVYKYKRSNNKQEAGPWAVYTDGEWAPRTGFTKRQAVNLAYSIAISKRNKLEVTFG